MLRFLVFLAVAYGVILLAKTLRRAAKSDPAAHLAQNSRAGPLPPGVADLSAELETIRRKFKFPALGAAALRGDKIIAAGMAGVHQAGGQDAATLADQFHLGSDTKAMTATLLGLFVDEGKLKWSTTVGEIFGETIPQMDPAWKRVTLAQLLQHRGGAPAQLDAGGLWRRLWEKQGMPMDQRRELVEGVVTLPPVGEPGTRYIYSNAGYAIAGAMAEKISGTPWEELMQQKVFSPLGITSAGFGPPGIPGPASQPWGHTDAGKPMDPGNPQADNPPAIGPAGTVHMALGDWAKFVALHLRGHAANPHREVKLLQPETFDALHRAGNYATGQPYAGGWLLCTRAWAKGDRPGDCGRALMHGGSNTLWLCLAWIAPEKDLAFLAVTNQGGVLAQVAGNRAITALIKQYAK